MELPHRERQSGYEELIELARGGSTSAAGRLFDDCRGYLLMVANRQLNQNLRAKVGGSDLVQQTLLYAHRALREFRGRSEKELLAWLERILVNEIVNVTRHFMETAKRDVSRELPLGQKSPSHSGGSGLPGSIETPSRHAVAREERTRLNQALTRLSKPYQQVIELRNGDLLSFAEIGTRMSIGAERARRLWFRAVERLRRELVTGTDFS